jgi:activating signal cointegrator 1
MKAITLHEPWAWAVLHGWKEVETRSWSTNYRGPLAIHAGKKRDVDGAMLHLKLNSCRGLSDHLLPPFEQLPFGCIIATCNLVAVFPTHLVETESKKLKRPFEPANGWDFERIFGNYVNGRFAWILRDVVPVVPHIETHGWQRLWNWTPPENLSTNLGLNP